MNQTLKRLNYPLLLDGGLSNVLESLGCDLNHKLWTARLIKENPQAIIQTHYEYIKAGAQILASSSYQVSGPGLKGLGYPPSGLKELLLKSIDLVDQAIRRAEYEGLILNRPLIAASLGPYGAYLADGSEYRGNYGISVDQLKEFHQERIEILMDSSADLFAFETIPSLEEAKVLSELLQGSSKPSWISFSCRNETEINDGTPIEKAVELFEDHPTVFAIGVNCTKPRFISELIQRIKKASTGRKIIVYPNSGEAFNAQSKTWVGTANPNSFVKMTEEWLALGADLVGGCCRIGPGHISQISNYLESSRKS